MAPLDFSDFCILRNFLKSLLQKFACGGLCLGPRLLWFPQNSVNVFKSIPKFPQISSSEACPPVSGFPQISSTASPNFLIRSLSPVSGFPQISSKSSKFPHQNPVPSSQDFHKFLQKHPHISPAAAFPCPLVLEFPQISSKTSPNFACGGLSPVPLVLGFPQISSKSPQKFFACGGRPHVLKNDPETRSIKKL